nr:IS110 family transposase [Actinopolyspora xinjiangensis]
MADLYPREATTDSRDAGVIADAARTMPHTPRELAPDDETVAALSMLCGHDDDLAAEATRVRNRLRGLLTQIHPHLERVLGPRLDHPAVLTLLSAHHTPASLRDTGHDGLAELLRHHAPHMADRLTTDIRTAPAEQTVVVADTETAGVVIPNLTASLRTVLAQRHDVESQLEALPPGPSFHGRRPRCPASASPTASRILIDVGDASQFPTATHPAAYAGLAPTTRSSGSSTRGEHPAKRGNKQLKRAFFLAAFASLHHPPSRAYYAKKTTQGKRHTQALLCLARRRYDVLHAMLKNSHPPPTPLAHPIEAPTQPRPTDRHGNRESSRFRRCPEGGRNWAECSGSSRHTRAETAPTAHPPMAVSSAAPRSPLRQSRAASRTRRSGCPGSR